MIFSFDVVILVFFLVYTTSGLVAGGKLFHQVFGIPYAAAVVLGALAILLYTSFGGFIAVCWTDAVQGLLMIGVLSQDAVEEILAGFELPHADPHDAVDQERVGVLRELLQDFASQGEGLEELPGGEHDERELLLRRPILGVVDDAGLEIGDLRGELRWQWSHLSCVGIVHGPGGHRSHRLLIRRLRRRSEGW